MRSTRSVHHELSERTVPYLLASAPAWQPHTADLVDVVAQRIMARKGRGDQRVLRVYDSPSMPEGEATIVLTKHGITDAKD
jgi:meiotic recombination protein DMC1